MKRYRTDSLISCVIISADRYHLFSETGVPTAVTESQIAFYCAIVFGLLCNSIGLLVNYNLLVECSYNVLKRFAKLSRSVKVLLVGSFTFGCVLF